MLSKDLWVVFFHFVSFFSLRLSVVYINVWLFGVLEHAVPYFNTTNDNDDNDEERNSHRVCEWFALCLRIETKEKKMVEK